MKVTQGIPKSKYADHRGCAPSAVTRAIKEGRITVLPDGSINPVLADAEWAENTRARVPKQRPPLGTTAAPPPVAGGDPDGDTVAHACALAAMASAHMAVGTFSAIEPGLRAALAAVPVNRRSSVRMPVEVWDALMGDLLPHLCADRGPDGSAEPISDEDAETVGAMLYTLACARF